MEKEKTDNGNGTNSHGELHPVGGRKIKRNKRRNERAEERH